MSERPLVEVLESETIVAGGTQKINWKLLKERVWISVSDTPGAVVETLDAGPGTVWERRIEMRLELGTELERTVSRPIPPRRQSALDYLEKDTRGSGRRVSRARYRVTARGRLERIDRP